MQTNRPIVLSVAGFDPCGGAGILADIKTFEQLKTQGMAVVTADTIQTEDQFTAIDWHGIDTVQKSVQSLMNRYSISVVKIGVVRDFEFLRGIIDTIRSVHKKTFVIWDPVLKSSSGFEFFNPSSLKLLPELMDHINMLTPNYEEYQVLKRYVTEKDTILIKGGHRKEQLGLDVLKTDKREITFLPTHTETYSKHGSGCVLSSAIAAHIALGKDLKEACRMGKLYVEQFLNSNPTLLGYHHD